MDEFTPKSMMTTTSMITITPNAVLVNGPLARNSLTIAIAEEGERATRIAPPKIATATRAGIDIFCMKGIALPNRIIVRVPNVNVEMTSPVVIQVILFRRSRNYLI